MANVNKMMILGRLVKDPELRTIPSGKKVCEFTVVTSDRYTDANGQKKEESEFHNLTAWDKQAEVIAQNKKKGDEIFIIAKKKTRSWDADGKKQYKIEFYVQEFEFIGSNKTSNSSVSAQDNDELPFD